MDPDPPRPPDPPDPAHGTRTDPPAAGSGNGPWSDEQSAADQARRPPLRRPREGRILFGVGAALADYTGLDVAIVRILIVVLTIVTSGFGLLVYLVAALLIPAAEAGAPRPVAQTRREGAGTVRDPLFWLGLGLLVVGALWAIGGPLADVGLGARVGLRQLVVPLVLVAFGLALWRAGDRRSTPAPPPGPTHVFPAGPAPSPPPGPASGFSSAWSASTAQASSPSRPSPPDPLPGRSETTESAMTSETSPPPDEHSTAGGPPGPGTGGGAVGVAEREDTVPIWHAGESEGDQPPPPPPTGGGHSDEPTWTPPPVPERRRSLLTRITLGVAFVTVGVLWSLRVADLLTISWGAILAAALLVVGLGALVGSIAGRARLLVVVGVLLAPIVLVSQVAAPWTDGRLLDVAGSWVIDGDARAAGEVRETPMTIDQLPARYELGAGSIQLDLTALDLDGEAVEVAIEVGAGEIQIFVPDDAEVTVAARSGIGSVEIFNRNRSTGFGATERQAFHDPSDPVGSIDLDLTVGLGVVRVDLVPRASIDEWPDDPDPAEPPPALDSGPEPEPGPGIEPGPGTQPGPEAEVVEPEDPADPDDFTDPADANDPADPDDADDPDDPADPADDDGDEG